MCAVPTLAPDHVTFSTRLSAPVGVGDRLQAGGKIDRAGDVRHRHASRLRSVRDDDVDAARTIAAGSNTCV